MEEKINKNGIKNILIFVITFFVGYFMVDYLRYNEVNIDKELTEEANRINKTCPMIVDQDLVLNNVTVLTNKVVQYNYTIVHLEKSQLDLEILKKEMESHILNDVKTNPDLKIYRDKKIILNYNYHDKKGVFVIKIVVTPDLYMEE